jgi:thiol:disulfide interchange protein
VRLATWILSAVLFGLTCGFAKGAHTKATLMVAADTAQPGETLLAGVKLEMEPRWHTYWKNPGASGMATKIEWLLPPGITAGEVQWPLPEKLPEQELTTYIYKDTVVLLVPLTLARDAKPGLLKLQAKLSWLECDVLCVPGNAEVEASLTVGSQQKPSPAAALLTSWLARLPAKDAALGAKASWEPPSSKDLRGLVLEWKPGTTASEPDFFPDNSEDFEIQGPTELLAADPGAVRIRKQVKKIAGDWPAQIAGVLVTGAGRDRAGHEVTLPTNGGASVSAAPLAQPLWKMLLYAFVGGLILNVMPCVLPVLALKVLGFVGQAKDDPRRARNLGLIYGLGVLLSFLALAVIVIAAKSAGQNAGWGLQFGNPYFLIIMTTLVTLISLNLFGVFEVHLAGRAMDAASKLSSGHGAAGAFFNGLLATVLATSCTAPFLGAAIGFAFAQPAPIVLLVLGTVGLGLAAPYVVLTWQPGWLKFLPKPGLWMERFKVAMGFPMLAAAVWLFNLASAHYAERSLWLAIFLVLLSLAAWVYGEFLQKHRSQPILAWGAIALILFAGYAFALESNLQWRRPVAPGTAATLQTDPNGIPWQPWTSMAVTRARSEGKPVLVDFTAKWCLTCNTIVKPALESSSVRDKLRQLNAATFLGDYTGFSRDITEELNRYGRAGVPLVLVFPKDPKSPAIVLPEALTPGMIVAALERAAR